MDIVERLRMKARGQRNSIGDHWGDHICSEAADEIERLRGFMSKLATALEHNKFHGTAEMIRDNIGK